MQGSQRRDEVISVSASQYSASETFLDVSTGTHRRALQTTVSSALALISALADTSVSHIVVSSGHYALSSELNITRAVTIEADVLGSVVLDAQAGSSSRRVLNINPSSASDVVELVGLNLTGGSVANDHGGGISVMTGKVTLSHVNVYSNTAAVSMRLLSNLARALSPSPH